MTVKFATEPIPSAMGKGKGGFRGKIVERSSRTFEEISAAVAKSMGTSEFGVQSIVRAFFEEMVDDLCETASDQHVADYGTLTVNLRGHFDGDNDVFDPDRHELSFAFKTGRRFKKCKPKFTLENRNPPVKAHITSIVGRLEGHAIAGYGCMYMVKGGDTTCNGENIKMLPGDSLTWSCKLADGREVSGPCEVYHNDAFTCDFRWPEAIPDEAVGRDITLTWRVRGGRATGMPVVVSRTVRLLSRQ